MKIKSKWYQPVSMRSVPSGEKGVIRIVARLRRWHPVFWWWVIRALFTRKPHEDDLF